MYTSPPTLPSSIWTTTDTFTRNSIKKTSFFFLMIGRQPRSTFFPYTSLFRSLGAPPEPLQGRRAPAQLPGRHRQARDPDADGPLLRHREAPPAADLHRVRRLGAGPVRVLAGAGAVRHRRRPDR